MIDPVFETRAELEAWATQMLRYIFDGTLAPWQIRQMVARVTLAHSHLIGDK